MLNMPRRSLRFTRMADLASLSAFLLMPCLPWAASAASGTYPAPTRTFQEELIDSILVGTAPDQISAAECQDCDDGGYCEAGFGFMSPQGELYFYDLGMKNIKVLRPGSRSPDRLRVIPGIEQRPDDGSVAPDGTVYLVADLGAAPNRFRIFQRSPNERAWIEEPVDVPWLGRDQKNNVAIHGDVRVEALRNGDVFLLGRGHPYEKAVAIARSGRFLPEDQRFITSQMDTVLGWAAPPNQTRRHIMVRGPEKQLERVPAGPWGMFLGSDAGANLYFMAVHGSSRFWVTLDKYDPHGGWEASVNLPLRHDAKVITGHSWMYAMRNGDVYELTISKTALVVVRWSVR